MDPILILSDLIAKLGYVGVAAAMLVEALFPPMPSELILPFAGFAASQGKLTLIGVFIAATIGSLMGAAIIFFIGRLVSDKRLERFIARWGEPIGIKQTDITKANEWFVKHGNKAVFFGRMIPGVRTLISLPAGISNMHFLPFMFWSALGTIFWTILLCTTGYVLGSRYHEVSAYVAPISKSILAVAVVSCAYLIFRKFRRKEAA